MHQLMKCSAAGSTQKERKQRREEKRREEKKEAVLWRKRWRAINEMRSCINDKGRHINFNVGLYRYAVRGGEG